MAGRLRRRPTLADAERAALARMLEDPTFEVLPLNGARDRVAVLRRGARVSVTASPARGIEATVDLAAHLQEDGLQAVPHLAAHMIRDRRHLRDLLDRLGASGVTRAFVVGGDAPSSGDFADGLALLRAMAEEPRRPAEIGIPGYPEGHPLIPASMLLAALRDKARLASWVTTQLCFDAAAVHRWIAERRADGLVLPVVVGVPGVTEPHRLLAIAGRIGVRDTRRFVTKNPGLAARLLRSGGFYEPASLLEQLAPSFAEPGSAVAGIHLYTFNEVAATEAWRQRFLNGLATT